MFNDKTIKKVALYSRVSTKEQTPENQKEALLSKAKREVWEYDYFEETESTRKTRPVKYKLYQKLLRNEYDAVVVWKLDRWGRSVKELVTEIEILYNRGVKFISITDPIDLSTDTGWLQFQIISTFAEFERRIISTRTKEAFFTDKKGVTRSRKTGKPVGKRGPDKKRRNRSGYYQRWSKK